LGQIRAGDKVVCCATKGDWKIVGAGITNGEYYVDDRKLFLGDGLFPDRFDFKAERLEAARELDVMIIIEDLSFVTNVAYWAVFFRSGIVKMTRADWDLSNKKLDQSPASIS
jgi:hypothetical protein